MSKPRLKVVSGSDHKPGIRTPQELDAVQAAIVPVDRVAREMEMKWGVGRLPELVSADTLAAMRRGFDAWDKAIQNGDVAGVRDISSKMVVAWQVMDAEATNAGHRPLDPVVWETPLPDGSVLAIVRTTAEAHAVAKQRDGRETICYTMEELARLLPEFRKLQEAKLIFPGATVERVTKHDSGFAQSFMTSDPLHDLLHGE